MPLKLKDLPYAMTALEPYISAKTLQFHHDKHHAAYVNMLNEKIVGTSYETMPLEDIIKKTAGKAEFVGIFNNAAQAWNHGFYWESMRPNGGGVPEGMLGAMIEEDFGSFEDFCCEFKEAAITQFGSGWAWLVEDEEGLRIMKTGNAETPLTSGLNPLLTCDVWEHAYYLDYQNRRPDYAQTFLNSLANWDFAERNLRTNQR